MLRFPACALKVPGAISFKSSSPIDHATLLIVLFPLLNKEQTHFKWWVDQTMMEPTRWCCSCQTCYVILRHLALAINAPHLEAVGAQNIADVHILLLSIF